MGKIGAFAMRSITYTGYEGPVYPINTAGINEIMGHKAFGSIEELPSNSIDLFLFAVPHRAVLEGLKAAVQKGCRAAVILTSGFREVGGEGVALEEELKQFANEKGIKIIGPNSLGMIVTWSKLNASFVPGLSDCFKEVGSVAFISQSGGVGNTVLSLFLDAYLNLSSFVCLGNRVNVEFADMLEYFACNKQTKVITLYMEGVDDGRRFLQAAKYCARQKPVVVFGTGYTESAKRAAQSHTGSMASSGEIYKAAFRQAGVLQVGSTQDLVDAAKVLLMCRRPKAPGVAIITHSAGPSIIVAEILECSGVKLADLSEETRNELSKKAVPGFGSVANPVDLAGAGGFDKNLYVRALEIVLKDPEVGAIMAIYTSMFEHSLAFPVDEFSRIARESGKPTVICFVTPRQLDDEFHAWENQGLPVFTSPERAAQAMISLFKWYDIFDNNVNSDNENVVLQKDVSVEKNIRNLRLKYGVTVISELFAKRLLKDYGIKTGDIQLARSAEEAVNLANRMSYPVVLKIHSDNVVHKSDVGGVLLNRQNAEEVSQGFWQIMEDVRRQMPEAAIEGVTVQPMLNPGKEVIIGAIRDPQFGPVVMCGLGGIWAETLQDFSFRVAPFDVKEALGMLSELRGFPYLTSQRGSQGIDLNSLARLLVDISRFVDLYEQIEQLDLNPVIAYPEGLAIADARIKLS